MAEMSQAGGETLLSEIHKLINSVWNKEELPDHWKEPILSVHKRVTKLTVIIIMGYHCYQLHTKWYRISSSSGLGLYCVGFDVTDQLLIRSFAFIRYWRKKWEYNETVHELFIDLTKAYNLVRREELYNILM
jgi:hypothetical protein